MNEHDFQRLETKLDNLTEAVTKLVLLEERQSIMAKTVEKQQEEHEKIKEEIVKVEAKIDKWVNRGFGAYGVLILFLTYFKYFTH